VTAFAAIAKEAVIELEYHCDFEEGWFESYSGLTTALDALEAISVPEVNIIAANSCVEGLRHFNLLNFLFI
jgi:hypothetical protein